MPVARLCLGLLALAGAVLAVTVPPGGAAAPAEVLPDLRQLVPDEMGIVVTRGGRERLVFSSTVVNDGPGPFVIEGRRRSRRTPLMTANQVVFRSDGSPVRVRDVGRLRYVRSPDHSHWHLLKLEIFELRHPDTGALVAPDRKTGFCPGNRYVVQRGLPVNWSRRAFGLRNDNHCGKGKARALAVLESISPGWADVYKPNLEGQFIDVTGVPAGRYVLVNRANAQRRMRETSYDNNVSSASVELIRTPGRRPTVRTLNYCRESAICP